MKFEGNEDNDRIFQNKMLSSKVNCMKGLRESFTQRIYMNASHKPITLEFLIRTSNECFCMRGSCKDLADQYIHKRFTLNKVVKEFFTKAFP